VSNLKTVQGIYENFGRGDVPAILEELRDDVRWDVFDPPTTSVDGIAYLVPRTGKAGVAEFFAAVAGLEIHGFEVANLLEGGNQVVAIIHVDVTITATGKRLQDYELHVWTFDDDGKVAELRHVIDTAKHAAANRA
jgi:ketosteroid isomerase-like protein